MKMIIKEEKEMREEIKQALEKDLIRNMEVIKIAAGCWLEMEEDYYEDSKEEKRILLNNLEYFVSEVSKLRKLLNV